MVVCHDIATVISNKLYELIEWQKSNKYIALKYNNEISKLVGIYYYGAIKIQKEEGAERGYHNYVLPKLYLIGRYYEFVDKAKQKAHCSHLINGFSIAAFGLGEIEKGIEIVEKYQHLAHLNNYIYHGVACLYVAAGKYDKALEQLELAKQYGCPYMENVKTDKDLQPLFNHERFKNLFK